MNLDAKEFWNCWCGSNADADTLRRISANAIASEKTADDFLLESIRKNVVDAETIYRGLRASPEAPILSYGIGDCFEMLPRSWSRDMKIAAHFFRKTWDAVGTPIFLRLTRDWNGEQFPMIHGFDVDAFFSHEPSIANFQQEIVTAGTFLVLDKQPLHDGWLLTVRQIGCY